MELLNKAIEQTEGTKMGITQATLKDFMLGRLDKVDFNAAVKDVRRFIVDESELRVINKNSLSSLISETDWK